jgi:hypothetical protein
MPFNSNEATSVPKKQVFKKEVIDLPVSAAKKFELLAPLFQISQKIFPNVAFDSFDLLEYQAGKIYLYYNEKDGQKEYIGYNLMAIGKIVLEGKTYIGLKLGPGALLPEYQNLRISTLDGMRFILQEKLRNPFSHIYILGSCTNPKSFRLLANQADYWPKPNQPIPDNIQELFKMLVKVIYPARIKHEYVLGEAHESKWVTKDIDNEQFDITNQAVKYFVTELNPNFRKGYTAFIFSPLTFKNIAVLMFHTIRVIPKLVPKTTSAEPFTLNKQLVLPSSSSDDEKSEAQQPETNLKRTPSTLVPNPAYGRISRLVGHLGNTDSYLDALPQKRGEDRPKRLVQSSVFFNKTQDSNDSKTNKTAYNRAIIYLRHLIPNHTNASQALAKDNKSKAPLVKDPVIKVGGIIVADPQSIISRISSVLKISDVQYLPYIKKSIEAQFFDGNSHEFSSVNACINYHFLKVKGEIFISNRTNTFFTSPLEGEIVREIHPNNISFVPDLKDDKILKEIRTKLDIPLQGKSKTQDTKLRDWAYGYKFVKGSFRHWRVVGVTNNNGIVGYDNNQLADGWYTFIITTQNIFRYLPTKDVPSNVASHDRMYTQLGSHSQLSENENVYGAGAFLIKNGQICEINPGSGHYRPGANYLKYTECVLKRMGVNTSAINFDYDLLVRFNQTFFESTYRYSREIKRGLDFLIKGSGPDIIPNHIKPILHH